MATEYSSVEEISFLALMGVLAFGCGASITAMIIKEIRRRRFLARAVLATEPVEVLAVDSKSMTVRFATPDGEVTTRIPRKSPDGAKGDKRPYGQGVLLKYDPADPTKAMIATENSAGFFDWIVILAILGLPCATGAYGFVAFFLLLL